MNTENITTTEDNFNTNSILDTDKVDKLNTVEDIKEYLKTQDNPITKDQVLDIIKNNKDIGFDGLTADDAMKISECMFKSINGEHITFKMLPSTIQLKVTSMMPKNINKFQSKNLLDKFADDTIKKLVGEYSLSESFEFENLKKDLDDADSKLKMNISGTIVVTYLESLIKSIDGALTVKENLIKDNKVEESEEIQKGIIDVLESPFKLIGFKEYCKTVKFKNIELEKPEKVFRDFNFKYVNSEKNIEDISKCPSILSEYFNTDIDKTNKAIIAFCKYCRTMDPNIIDDHIFMYYFVKNTLMVNIFKEYKDNGGVLDERADAIFKEFLSSIEYIISLF